MKSKQLHVASIASVLVLCAAPLLSAQGQSDGTGTPSLIDKATTYLSGNAAGIKDGMVNGATSDVSGYITGYLSGSDMPSEVKSNLISLSGGYNGIISAGAGILSGGVTSPISGIGGIISSGTGGGGISTTADGFVIDDASASDCAELRNRLNARFQAEANEKMPSGKPSDATGSRGINEIMAMANAADPIAAVTSAAVRMAVNSMINRADTFIENKVASIRNAIASGLSPDALRALGIVKKVVDNQGGQFPPVQIPGIGG